ncbi:uncharacterized protein LOC131674175 [Phymastichus coffea]|uniref:uncharacterized protein LOC131674175 n=1 Tax=Phymastichus coffea TaxID=108790 RepID=UPI00273C048F|nr:uncharacterized protein LOC131674175 [Phymastichus coffea]
MPVITDEDAVMDEQVNIATQASNVNSDSQSLSENSEEQHSALTLTGSKRHQEFPVEDGLECSPKYPKLEIVQKSFEPKEDRRVFCSLDEFWDRSLNAENRHHKENIHPIKNLCHSSEKNIQHQSEKSVVKFDADSIAILSQRKISNIFVHKIEEKKFHKTSNKYNNINAVVNLEAKIKKNSSQLSNSSENTTDEPVSLLSIPENLSSVVTQEEYLHQETSDQTETYNNNAVTQQETIASNYLYTAISHSSRQHNLNIEYSSSQDQSSQSSQSIYQDQNEDGQSIGNQIYPPMFLRQMIDNEVPSTSSFEENDLRLTMSSSDLAQLLLSLKCDLQKLTERVDQNEVTLKAIVHGNPTNLSVLFTPSFKEKHNLKIPFSKLEDFLKFNDDLSKNQNFSRDFVTSLTEFIDKKVTLAKNILNMIKPYMSKEVVILFNASKPAQNKLVLKDYFFCKCLLQATQITLQGDKLPLEHEKAFMKNLGHVISGARGWHTHSKE